MNGSVRVVQGGGVTRHGLVPVACDARRRAALELSR